MKYVECPDTDLSCSPHQSIFLAGSITGAGNWQKETAENLLHKYNVFNPRRANFDNLIPEIEREQIKWEWEAIAFCRHILFWFSYETVAPITLFEYGKVLARIGSYRNIFVGVHPDYSRIRDVLVQTELECPHIKIVHSLDDLVSQVLA